MGAEEAQEGIGEKGGLMGFKPMRYIEEDGITGPRRLHSGHPDPRGHPPWSLDKTSLQGACEALKKECEEIEAKRKEKIISGSLEDIRGRLMIK